MVLPTLEEKREVGYCYNIQTYQWPRGNGWRLTILNG